MDALRSTHCIPIACLTDHRVKSCSQTGPVCRVANRAGLSQKSSALHTMSVSGVPRPTKEKGRTKLLLIVVPLIGTLRVDRLFAVRIVSVTDCAHGGYSRQVSPRRQLSMVRAFVLSCQQLTGRVRKLRNVHILRTIGVTRRSLATLEPV